MALKNPARRTILVYAGLAVLTLAAYWLVVSFDFINYDDDQYVTKNPHVLNGIHWKDVVWALQTGYAGNWHPVTWVSHMLDCQLYGLRAAGHHVTNLLIHVANTLLLFGVLRRVTSDEWRVTSDGRRAQEGLSSSSRVTRPPSPATWASFFVAGLFALHPLHVESVAWVSERKDVLSTFFLLLALWAYWKYVASGAWRAARAPTGGMPNVEHRTSNIEHPSGALEYLESHTQHTGSGTPHPTVWYALTLLVFALGLMTKPMLVTLPFVLLLLDYWPLGRLAVHSPRSTVHSPQAPEGLSRNTPVLRSSATAEGGQYATRYTLHAPRSTLHAAFRLLIEKWPFFALAAASCVVTFVVQRGEGAVVSLNELPLGFRLSNVLISYVRYMLKMVWPVDLAIFYPPPAEWPLGWVLGAALFLAGVTAAALLWARKAPWFVVGWFWYLGTLVPVIGIVQVGNQSMADRYSYIPLIGLFMAIAWSAAAAVARWPSIRTWVAAGAVASLLACAGLTWQQAGYWRSSTSLFEHALAVTRDNYVAHYNIASVRIAAGDPAGAEPHVAEAVRLKPYDADARYSLGVTLAALHKAPEATEQYRESLKLRPDFPEVLNNLAWILAASSDPQVRNGPEAVLLAERACKLTDYKKPLLVGTLAAAYAEAGRFPEAVASAEKALRLAEQGNQPDLVARNRELLERYRAGRPARDEP